MRNFSRTARAQHVLTKRTRAEIEKALDLRDNFQRRGLKAMAQGALDARITVVVRMSVGDFLEHAANEAHGRYMAHLEVCGCRAVGLSCGAGDALLEEWKAARDLVRVDA